MTINYAQSFFELAVSDLRSSFVLHERKLYAPAFFHFQQCVEKANKCYGLLIGTLTNEDALKFGYDQMKIYRKYISMAKEKMKEGRTMLEPYDLARTHALAQFLNDPKLSDSELDKGVKYY